MILEFGRIRIGKAMMRCYVYILVLGMMSACMGSDGAGVEVTPAPVADVAANNTLGSMLNGVRSNNGVGALTYDSRLAQAAQAHAADMLQNNYFSHTGQNGSSVGSRVTAQGYQWSWVGENIAKGQRDEAEVMTDWTNSPGHHANNIRPEFQDFGLGKAGSGSSLHWVLVFATPL